MRNIFNAEESIEELAQLPKETSIPNPRTRISALNNIITYSNTDLFRTNHNIDPLVNGMDVWMV
jgi:hypothetical protein